MSAVARKNLRAGARVSGSDFANRRGLVDLVFTGAATAAGAAFAFIANVVIARGLGVDGYGRYVTIVSAAMVLGGVATYGVGPLLTRELAGHARGSRREVLRTLGAWAARLTAALAMVGGGGVLVWLTFIPTAPLTTWSVRIAGAIIVPLYAGTILVSSVLAGDHRVSASQVVSSVLRNAALLAGAIGLLSVGLTSVATITWLQVIAVFIALGIGVVWSHRSASAVATGSGSLPVHASTPMAPSEWRRAARHFFVISLAALVLFRLDVVIVSTVAGPTQAGLFGAAARIGQLTQLVGLVWIAWLRPRMAFASGGNDRVRLAWLLRWGTAGAALTTLVPVAIGWVAAPQLLSLMGSGFSGAVWPMRWLLMSWLPWAASVPAYAYLSMSGHEIIASRVLWLQVALIAVGGIPLIAIAGASGGAWAWFGANLLESAIMIGVAVRTYNGSYPQDARCGDVTDAPKT